MRLMWMRAVRWSCAVLVIVAQAAAAEVVRVEIQQRRDEGTHERLVGRVFFEVDPALAANQAIADLALAPRNARGRVEFSSDLLLFLPKSADRARGTVFLEVVNRGRDQSLVILSGARQDDLSPAAWNMGDRFLLEQGFTVAFLGWQFDVQPSQGLTFDAPIVDVDGIVRASFVETDTEPRAIGLRLPYCPAPGAQDEGRVVFKRRMQDAPLLLPRDAWQFDVAGCAVRFLMAQGPGLYEPIYPTSGSAVAGLGLAAVRDFASYLKHGPDGATLRENPSLVERVIGFGYSQSGRFLRDFVRDGFNADERGRRAFDGLLVASAGAGGGSFNHRFAMPGQAGNSVLSSLRPVDLPPFADDQLLARARASETVPKIFYTFSSTEYWARAGSLTHTTEDGADGALAPTSRLYFMAGTPHAGGPLPPSTIGGEYRHPLNFAQQRWTMRALVVALDEWVRADTAPPASIYPTVLRGELVPLEELRFPAVPALPRPDYMPQVWRLDFGGAFASTGVITREPPDVGAPFRVLVPQVTSDGNELGGIRIPEVAVPLGTHTGWNITNPQLRELGYLAGLVGSFVPFAPTREAREAAGDPRPSIAERYRDRDDYLSQVAAAAKTLVGQRFLLADDVDDVLGYAARIWSAVVP